MALPIRIKRTLTSNPPASLAVGEMALTLGRELVTKRVVIPTGVIYTAALTNPSPGWQNWNVRVKASRELLKPPALGGDHITVSILFGPGTNGTLNSFYVGEPAIPGNPFPYTTAINYSFAGPPFRLTVGGQGTFPVVEGVYTCDPLLFPYDRTKELLFSIYCSGGPINLPETVGTLLGAHSWYGAQGPDLSHEINPGEVLGNYTRFMITPIATVTRIPPVTHFTIPDDFVVDNNTIEAIGAGIDGEFGVRNVKGGDGGTGGCYAKIVNFDPGFAKSIPFQVGVSNGTVGAGKGPTANTWFGDVLLAAGGDDSTANCVGEAVFAGGLGAPGGSNAGGGGGGAGGPNGPGAAGAVGQDAPGTTGGAGGRGGGGAGGLGGAGGAATSGWPGGRGAEFQEAGGSGGGGGGGYGPGITGGSNSGHGGSGGLFGGGGGGSGTTGTGIFQIGRGGTAGDGAIIVTYVIDTGIRVWVGTPKGVEQLFGASALAVARTVADVPSASLRPQIIRIKRTTTPGNVPASLAIGELALGLGDTPIKVWAGTPSGVQEV